MIKQLIHNGVVVPEPQAPHGLTLSVRGQRVSLTPKQEEMALAWAKKQGTPYVEDKTFVQNFLADFSTALELEPPLKEDEVDFGPALAIIAAERRAREGLTADERKAQASERKAAREALREQFGHAIVDGERVELANYVVEPSGIFMGRGKHPLRGKWKEAARHVDITLNLSPDAPRPAGDWAEIVWQPDSLWVARWADKLSGKQKYVWLSDTASIKQSREARKFDKAHTLDAEIESVRGRIQADLEGDDPRLRMLATACYLIDALGLRVGDEKDSDEADTVGATTLRVEHVKLHDDGVAEFKFLGKDSVEWHKKLPLPDAVQRSLAELIQNARPSGTARNGGRSRVAADKPQIFPDISSRDVNAYLSGILPGLTAKVFRTHHATTVVRDSLEKAGVGPDDPDYKKWEAANLANLEAAVLCNHTKKAPAGWPAARKRFKERQRAAETRVEQARAKVKATSEALEALRKESRERREAAPQDKRQQVKERYEKRIEQARKKLETAREQLERAQLAAGKVKVQADLAAKKRTWNLGTSLKSYIDPRVYYRWGQRVNYDALANYYPTLLQRKFAWVKTEDGDENGDEL
jgi:DNA topoisomerase-1